MTRSATPKERHAQVLGLGLTYVPYRVASIDNIPIVIAIDDTRDSVSSCTCPRVKIERATEHMQG